MIIPVLLAGGEGKRLWPLSNSRTPKQFLSVISNNITLYQSTVERVTQCVSTRNVVTVTGKSFAAKIHEQFKPFELVHKNHALLEPFGRNTAAAVTLAALYIQARFGNAIMWVVPSDHIIERKESLKKAIEIAMPHVRQGNILTFGVKPVRVDSNYGYIVAEGAQEAILNVERFIEKPSFNVIQGLQNKHYYWNSGMFLFSVDTLLAEMKRYAGDVLKNLTQAYENTYKLQSGIEVLPEHYEHVPLLPLDKVIMEYSKKLKVIPVDMGWADVGSWQSLWEFTNENINDNINPPLHNGLKECSNCLAYLNKRLALSVY